MSCYPVLLLSSQTLMLEQCFVVTTKWASLVTTDSLLYLNKCLPIQKAVTFSKRFFHACHLILHLRGK